MVPGPPTITGPGSRLGGSAAGTRQPPAQFPRRPFRAKSGADQHVTLHRLNAARPGRIYCSDRVGTAGRSKVRDASLTAKCRLPVQRCGMRRHVSQRAGGVLLLDGQDVGLNEGLKVRHLAWGDAVPGRRNNGRRPFRSFSPSRATPPSPSAFTNSQQSRS